MSDDAAVAPIVAALRQRGFVNGAVLSPEGDRVVVSMSRPDGFSMQVDVPVEVAFVPAAIRDTMVFDAWSRALSQGGPLRPPHPPT